MKHELQPQTSQQRTTVIRIRSDYATGHYFYKRNQQKQISEDTTLPNETNSNYSSDSMK